MSADHGGEMWQYRDGALFGPTALLVLRNVVAAWLIANSGTCSTISQMSVTVRPVANPPPIKPLVSALGYDTSSVHSVWSPYWAERFTRC